MPILNLGTICSTATKFAGGRNDWDLSEASLYANMAYSELKSRTGIAHTPSEAIAVSSTTSGENRIAFPADFDYPLAITLYAGSSSTVSASHTTDSWTLVPKDARWADAQTLASGIPENYVYYGTSIELFPSPNSAYSLVMRYRTQSPLLVASTDTPVLDERWHSAILYKTVAILEASRNNPEGEALANNRYLQYVNTTITDASTKQRDRAGMYLRFGSKVRRD
jgi:hypothetical protein